MANSSDSQPKRLAFRLGADSAQPKKVFDAEAGVLQDVTRQTSPQVARMDWHHDDAVVLSAEQDQMTAALTIFGETLAFEEFDEFLRGQGWQPRTHLGDLDEHLGHLCAPCGKRKSSGCERFQIQVNRFANLSFGLCRGPAIGMTSRKVRHPRMKTTWRIRLDNDGEMSGFHDRSSILASRRPVNISLSANSCGDQSKSTYCLSQLWVNFIRNR